MRERVKHLLCLGLHTELLIVRIVRTINLAVAIPPISWQVSSITFNIRGLFASKREIIELRLKDSAHYNCRKSAIRAETNKCSGFKIILIHITLSR
jgi:hypothetical protein